MPKQSDLNEGVDAGRAKEVLRAIWQEVSADAVQSETRAYLKDARLRDVIAESVNHRMVSYRFCLPIQLLGKVVNPKLDCLRMQRRKGDPSDITGWDARSLGSKVVAPFNSEQENVLGTSQDPYVGNPMRLPKMVRDDTSKKDILGWNKLVELLELVESRKDANFTANVFKQVLLEVFNRQKTLRFSYPIPPRVSLESTLKLCEEFVAEKSGGDRALAVTGALFDAIGIHFGLYSTVNRARINASDEATGMGADLECVGTDGQIVLTVEVKDRTLTLTDVEGTLLKSRQRSVKNIFFTARDTKPSDIAAVQSRVNQAFASGQNLYIFQFYELSRSVLALGGESIRTTFLRKVGEHLDTWNTQPQHRQAWQKLLRSL